MQGALGSPRLCSVAVRANVGTRHKAAAQAAGWPGKPGLSSPPPLSVNQNVLGGEASVRKKGKEDKAPVKKCAK